MLPKGSIQKIIEYYTTRHEFDEDMERAILEFFELEDMEALGTLLMDEISMGLFNEWLVYDFKMPDGKTLIEDFAQKNPENLSQQTLSFYRNLINTNHYAYFEVQKVLPEEGLVLEDIVTGKVYDVKEKSATRVLKEKTIFYGRVGKVNGNWELVGANTSYLPIQITERVKDLFRKDPKPFSPKDAYAMGKNDGESPDLKKVINPQTAIERLDSLLKAHGLNEMVSAKIVAKWCADAKDLHEPFGPLSLIYGLASEGLTKASADVLVQAVQDVYNTTAKKQLGNLSPQDKFLQDPDRVPDFISDIHPIGGGKWMKHCDRAHEFMQAQKYFEAVEEFKKTFVALLAEATTRKDIYRLLANKAVCHFACGQEDFGVHMLDLALDLNLNYDFAVNMLAKYENGDYDNDILLGRMRLVDELKSQGVRVTWRKALGHATDKEVNEDPAVKYVKYLKKLKINFATKELTTSQVVIYGAKGKVGRNDSCPCGNGLKYKKCHGK